MNLVNRGNGVEMSISTKPPERPEHRVRYVEPATPVTSTLILIVSRALRRRFAAVGSCGRGGYIAVSAPQSKAAA